MRIFEVEGDSVEEIIAHFVQQQGIPKDYIEYEIVEQGSKGILGIGKKSAKVKIKYDEGAHIKRKAKIVLDELLDKIGFSDAHISAEDGGDGRIVFNIDTDAPEILIGKSAQTLDAIQYIFDKIINLPEDSDVMITVDAGYYRKKKVEETVDKALALAEKVKKTGRSVKMPPMAAIIRKEVHIALRNVPGVNTVSFGDGQLKQLSIVPDKARGGGKHFSGKHSPRRRG